MLLHSGRRTGPQHELDSKEKKKEKEFKNECVKRKLQRNILYTTIYCVLRRVFNWYIIVNFTRISRVKY